MIRKWSSYMIILVYRFGCFLGDFITRGRAAAAGAAVPARRGSRGGGGPRTSRVTVNGASSASAVVEVSVVAVDDEVAILRREAEEALAVGNEPACPEGKCHRCRLVTGGFSRVIFVSFHVLIDSFFSLFVKILPHAFTFFRACVCVCVCAPSVFYLCIHYVKVLSSSLNYSFFYMMFFPVWLVSFIRLQSFIFWCDDTFFFLHLVTKTSEEPEEVFFIFSSTCCGGNLRTICDKESFACV